ncbi:MAG: amidohydrolase family protein [Candidatus Jordarchaeales archaeon]
MVINVHAHLAHKDMWSDAFWSFTADGYAKTLGLPKEVVMEQLLPQFWSSNADVFVKVMDAAGIDKAIITGVDFGLMPETGEAKWSVEEMNRWVAKQADEYPDKLVPLCAVDPRRGERAIKLIEKAVEEWGAKGVKFHPTAGYYPDNPAFYPLYEKCVELGVPLHSHTAAIISAPMESKYADPIYVDSVAAKFPDLKIVLIHFGGLTWILKCVEIMTVRPNVYAEISGHQLGARGMTRYWLSLIRDVINMPAILGRPLKDRIMFGTDWPYLVSVMGDDAWVNFIKSLPQKGKEYGIEFTEEEARKLLKENASKILSL